MSLWRSRLLVCGLNHQYEAIMLTSGTTRHSLITVHIATTTEYYSRTLKVFLKENTLAGIAEQTTVQ